MMKQIVNRKILKTAFLKTLPVMSGYLVLGMGFGIISEKNGYGLLWALAMSVFIYAGSMQYVTVSLLTSGASLISAALTTFMVNARHLFYGISMLEKYKNAGKKKPYLIFALTDETYSLVCTGDYPEGEDPHTYCLVVSFMNHCYWVLGSVFGAAIGSAISFNTAGVDFAMTALFVTVFVEQWLSTENHISAITGVTASLVCLMIFGQEHFLIPSMAVIILVLSLGKKRIEEIEKKDAAKKGKTENSLETSEKTNKIK